MKLLDPFSGYRLAQGHVLLHLAYFIAIFLIENEPKCPSSNYEAARTFLLVAHMLIFCISFISTCFVWYFLGKHSRDAKLLGQKNFVQLVANFFEASSLLVYQAVIYYTQA